MMSIRIANNVDLDHLVKVVSTLVFHCKLIIFLSFFDEGSNLGPWQ